MCLLAIGKRLERLEKIRMFNRFHIICVDVGTPKLNETAERHIANEPTYAAQMKKLPFVFRLNTARNAVVAV